MNAPVEAEQEPDEPVPPEAVPIPAVIPVLARILVRLALEEEGGTRPANHNVEQPR